MTASPWSPEDRALMLAYEQYLATLCPGCRQPKDRAWHPEMEGWWHTSTAFCHACKALGHTDETATYRGVIEDPAAAADNPTDPLTLTYRDPEDTAPAPGGGPAAKPGEEAGLDE